MESLNKVMPRASMRTARMSEKELLNYGFTHEQIEAGMQFPWVGGGTNSTQIIADLKTVKTAYDSGVNASTYQGRAIAAAGPIADVDGALGLLILKAQEMKELINYLAFGTMIGSGTSGIFRSGDSDHASAYDLLIGIQNDLV